ncbi:alkaline phosphatase family protein, partial [Candidatus Woesearchaeota archaeon]|nr:alkaline phosphatase family protein [Candidatus Woesearchaeota archaeon]
NNITLLALPGSTPPELKHGITIRGRWGGWGADFHAINFESAGNLEQRIKQGRAARLFFFGPQLTQYINPVNATGWIEIGSYSKPLEIAMTAWGGTLYGLIIDTTDDNATNYDRLIVSLDKSKVLAQLNQGEWSDWLPIDLKWGNQTVSTQVRVKVIKLEPDGFFRVRLFYNNLNEYNTEPGKVAKAIIHSVGPMMDFVDNFPPQLIYYPEDKQTFLEEMNMTFDWHTKTTDFILSTYKPEIYISDIYSPNQMLTSRWWMGYIDPNSHRYNDIDDAERAALWDEVLSMYKRVDTILGKLIEHADNNTVIVFSSDHGAVPLNKWVHLNNLFAQKGWLKFSIDNTTGEPIIDWENSKVIYLKFDNIYINPKGLAGNYERASGPEYEQLREEVKQAIEELVDPETGYHPAVAVVKWEEVAERLKLPPERIGDLVVANMAGYGWNEEMTSDLEIFTVPLKSGYKQAIISNKALGMWAPFMIVGPGVKRGHFIQEPIEMVDEYPTIMTALGMPLPEFVEGKVVEEVFT